MQCIKHKHKLYKNSIHGIDEEKTKYKPYKNILTTTILNAKFNHYKNYFTDNKNNLKKTRDKLSSLIRRSKKSFTISDILEIETLNNHFTSVRNNYATKINNNTQAAMVIMKHVKVAQNSFHFSPITQGEITNTVKLFKKQSAPGYDGIIPKIL